MQLHFLGNSYNSSSNPIETTQINISGKYRGNQVSFRTAPHQSSDSIVPLKYRGVSY